MASMLFANVLVPQALLHRLQLPNMTFAIGQYIMVNSKDFEEVGGYKALGDKCRMRRHVNRQRVRQTQEEIWLCQFI